MLWALVVVVVSILGMSFVVWLLRGHHRPDDGPGPGGPGGPPPDPPPTPPDPAWWPQFERDLAAYMAGRRPRGERANAP